MRLIGPIAARVVEDALRRHERVKELTEQAASGLAHSSPDAKPVAVASIGVHARGIKSPRPARSA